MRPNKQGNVQRFNSRSREGSDVMSKPIIRWMGGFQFALPRGERHKGRWERDVALLFQFALPRGERPPGGNEMAEAKRFQFALPRGERPVRLSRRRSTSSVSIRAPARGATGERVQAQSDHQSFNSRSREGSDF